MKKIIVSILKKIIDKVKRNKFIQNIFESPFDFEKFENMGTFKDSFDNSHKLYQGLRSKIRPGWENMLKKRSTNVPQSKLEKLKTNGTIAVEKMIPIINMLGKSIEDSTILEIGCHSGAASFAFADIGAKKVVGSEFTGYKVRSVDIHSNNNEKQLEEVNENLKLIRNSLKTKFKNTDRVGFVEDDICNSKLSPGSFDIICSWEVLEHIHDPKGAFIAINSLLKKDGITIHHYNPFFCINGGHSLCTLDFLWGHVRLNETDFVKYLDEYRPLEKDMVLSFYKEGVNRMTFQDLEQHISDSGLETIAIIPFNKEQHFRMVDKDVLSQCQNNYPSLNLKDLIAPEVLVIAKKN